MKEVIARQQWSEGYKQNVIDAYQKLLELQGIVWTKPLYKRVEKVPFIPSEKEIDHLIAGVSFHISVFLQLLKETAIRPGEAWNLKWIDVDADNRTVRITPEKNSYPRQLKMSSHLVAMLLRIEKENERIFSAQYQSLNNLRRTFQRQRNRISQKLCNPRLCEITFRTFRHWKATMEYHKTKDILHVKQLLGHKNINNTLIYTHLVSFESDDWVCKVAQTLEEAVELVEAGFEYVTEVEGKKIFRKRARASYNLIKADIDRLL